MKKSEQEKIEAIEKLRELLKPGDTVYTILTHVSRSGMSRSIKPIIFRDSRPYDLTYLVCKSKEGTFDRNNGGVKVGGCGMDMGFNLVYNLSYRLFSKDTGVSDGGYALRREWI